MQLMLPTSNVRNKKNAITEPKDGLSCRCQPNNERTSL